MHKDESEVQMVQVATYECECASWDEIGVELKKYCGIHGGKLLTTKEVNVVELRKNYDVWYE